MFFIGKQKETIKQEKRIHGCKKYKIMSQNPYIHFCPLQVDVNKDGILRNTKELFV